MSNNAIQVIRPQSFAELHTFAKVAAMSGMVPKDYVNKPEAVMIAVQMGSEIGLAPMQSLQNIAVINGRPSVWGDAMLGLCKAHPSYQGCVETVEGDGDARTARCEMRRAGEPPIVRTFSVAEAKKAGLWGKSIWAQYPDRMLQMRARGFAARDAFPDALRGLISAEEARDIPTDAPPHAGPTIEARAEPVPTDPMGDPAPRAPLTLDNAPKMLDLIDALTAAVKAATTVAEIEAATGHPRVIKALDVATNGAKARLDDVLAFAADRMGAMMDAPPETPPADDFAGDRA
jgi:hypothetical protein